MSVLGRPRFLISVDTEGDNLWARPRAITTHNARFLPAFQRLCERYGLRPTYLTNFEMACDPAFQRFGRGVIRRGTAEIGMHLHAWNTPPLVPLTPDDFRHQPYLIEYPAELVREKVGVMTKLLGEQLGVRPVSHRAGRWALDSVYARALGEQGYLVDCSVTPGISWRDHLGDPRALGGSDYHGFLHHPYFVDLDHIARPGRSSLLEIPMTIVPARRSGLGGLRKLLERLPEGRRALHRLLPSAHWLRPNGRNGRRLLQVAHHALREGRAHLQLMIHSSELMPGGSPRFQTERDVEILYQDLERLFALAAKSCLGATLQEFREAWSRAIEPQAAEVGGGRS